MLMFSFSRNFMSTFLRMPTCIVYPGRHVMLVSGVKSFYLVQKFLPSTSIPRIRRIYKSLSQATLKLGLIWCLALTQSAYVWAKDSSKYKSKFQPQGINLSGKLIRLLIAARSRRTEAVIKMGNTKTTIQHPTTANWIKRGWDEWCWQRETIHVIFTTPQYATPEIKLIED